MTPFWTTEVRWLNCQSPHSKQEAIHLKWTGYIKIKAKIKKSWIYIGPVCQNLPTKLIGKFTDKTDRVRAFIFSLRVERKEDDKIGVVYTRISSLHSTFTGHYALTLCCTIELFRTYLHQLSCHRKLLKGFRSFRGQSSTPRFGSSFQNSGCVCRNELGGLGVCQWSLKNKQTTLKLSSLSCNNSTTPWYCYTCETATMLCWTLPDSFYTSLQISFPPNKICREKFRKLSVIFYYYELLREMK